MRRPSSAGAPPLIHVTQEAEKLGAVKENDKAEPGENEWKYCSLPIASEMAECLAGQHTHSIHSVKIQCHTHLRQMDRD